MAMQAPADEALIGRIARGDRLAMQVLFARHHVRIYRFVLRLLRDEMAAEDVIGECSWTSGARPAGLKAEAPFRLGSSPSRGSRRCRCCASGARTDWTRKRRNSIEEPSDDPELAVAKLDKGEKLRKCLAALSPEHREIIDLVYYHEKSVEEVAQIVGIPENTVKTRMFYARKKLGELCRMAGIDRGWP